MSKTTPSTMRYVQCSSEGGPEVMGLKTGSVPLPKANEVLIRVHAAGVNRPDIAQRKGSYPPPPDASPILGLEVAGEVVSFGSQVKDWKIGDQVCALTHGGGYAEFCVAPATQCLSIPLGFSMERAAGIPENFFTVWTNVIERGRVKKDEYFLVHGGTSGIGLTAIQLARKIGAKVIATAGSDEKCKACLEYGASLAIHYHEKDFVTEAKTFTQGRGVDLVLDMVGGSYFQKNLDVLAVEGRLVQIATQQGAEVNLNLSRMMSKRLTITGSTLRPRSIEDKSWMAQNLKTQVWPWLESGEVKVVIHQVFPFEQVSDAHRLMETSQHIGKIILKII